MAKPGKPHLDAVHRVLQYLKNEPWKGLLFSSNTEIHIKGLLILIGLHVLTLGALSQGITSSLETPQCFGNQRNNSQFLDLRQKQNIGPQLQLLVRLYEFCIFLEILVQNTKERHCYFVIAKQLCTLAQTKFFTREQNLLRQIAM